MLVVGDAWGRPGAVTDAAISNQLVTWPVSGHSASRIMTITVSLTDKRLTV